MAEAKKNPIATLKAQAKEFDFSKLRAAEKITKEQAPAKRCIKIFEGWILLSMEKV
ncbi:hypothetical protein IHO40_03650 [Wolbachia endosymbiont of Mansonella ozzardi]|uniref:hypothetical protein n=1 Tax=Wolbachia endosymbiont of Mansonella ozzardi TaxID=137464 RepID=UPI001CE2113A|nr:hypothetical protein [Wolbachia endosymbiont of Mansonella ozzardi]MCA4775185.1 hypothetical protein [Wolbachia endosymbiont of Mansonella ozzardi]